MNHFNYNSWNLGLKRTFHNKPYMGYINKCDQKFGLQQETICLPIINKFFKFNLLRPEGEFNHFDFFDIDRNTYVELKSRNYFSTSFNDYEIGHWKIHKAIHHLKNGARVYIVNNFIDKMVYYELTLENIQKLDYRMGGTKKWGIDEIEKYYYIPRKDCKVLLSKDLFKYL